MGVRRYKSVSLIDLFVLQNSDIPKIRFILIATLK